MHCRRNELIKGLFNQKKINLQLLFENHNLRIKLIVEVLFQTRMPNISWFQLIKCDILLLVFVILDQERDPGLFVGSGITINIRMLCFWRIKNDLSRVH